MLKITRINGVLNATIYSLTETAPLKLKEPGQFGNRVSLVMCSASLKASLSENLQRMFLLIGGGNPEEKRTLFTSYNHCLLEDPNSLLSDNQLLEMASIDGGNLWSTALQPNG